MCHSTECFAPVDLESLVIQYATSYLYASAPTKRKNIRPQLPYSSADICLVFSTCSYMHFLKGKERVKRKTA